MQLERKYITENEFEILEIFEIACKFWRNISIYCSDIKLINLKGCLIYYESISHSNNNLYITDNGIIVYARIYTWYLYGIVSMRCHAIAATVQINW